MKRLYVLAAAVSVTGGMAFAAPKENAPEKEEAVLDVQTPPYGVLYGRHVKEIPRA